MKILKDILYKTGITEIIGSTDIPVQSLCANSRESSEGCIFIAVRGTHVDGHVYISQSVANGAVAVVCENFPTYIEEDITYVKVKDSAIALGQIASNFYDDPSSRLKLIGITGTNGKTTIASLLYNLFRLLGYKVGLVSTIVYRINDEEIPSTHTTPDTIMLHSLLDRMAKLGCEYCFMEVSSHAVVQQRIAGIEFSGAVFTNLTHDHLDYHQTFDNYLKAKKELFDKLPAGAFAVANADDRNGAVMLQNTKAAKYFYSLQSMADYRCRIVENQFTGLQLNVDGQDVWCHLIGTFNAYNLLAIYATAMLLGQDRTEVLTFLSKLESVEGRFDYFRTPENITAIVDYAHTPDALKNILQTIQSVRTGAEKIITLIGCGGDRDAAKRPLMARIACELSDKVIITSDNPRSEEPEAIIEQMKKGAGADQMRKVISIVNRREAIGAACMMAVPGDILLVAGKGHEKCQEIKGVRYPFDDKAILKEILFKDVKE